MQAYDKVIRRILAPQAETLVDVVAAMGGLPPGRYLAVTSVGSFLVRVMASSFERLGILDVVSACGRLAPDRSMLVLGDVRGQWAGAVVGGRDGGWAVYRGPVPAATDEARAFRVFLEVRPADMKP